MMMPRTFLSIPILLTRTGNSLQDFTGIGTVQCPVAAPADNTTTDDGETGAPPPLTTDSCELSYASPGGLVACVLACPAAASFVVDSLVLMDGGETYLPCACTRANHCPDSCTFTSGARLPKSYRGPGRLTCPVDAYIASLCTPVDDDNNNCHVTAGFGCAGSPTRSTVNPADWTIRVDVLCECWTLTCTYGSPECTYESVMPMMPPQTVTPSPIPAVAATPATATPATAATPTAAQPSPSIFALPVVVAPPPPTVPTSNDTVMVTPIIPTAATAAASPTVAGSSTPTIMQEPPVVVVGGDQRESESSSSRLPIAAGAYGGLAEACFYPWRKQNNMLRWLYLSVQPKM